MALQNIVDILFGFNPFHKFYISVFSDIYSNDANFALLYLSEKQGLIQNTFLRTKIPRGLNITLKRFIARSLVTEPNSTTNSKPFESYLANTMETSLSVPKRLHKTFIDHNVFHGLNISSTITQLIR